MVGDILLMDLVVLCLVNKIFVEILFILLVHLFALWSHFAKILKKNILLDT